MTQTPDRPRLDDLTGDQYDQLCEQLEQARAAIDLRDAVIDLIKARAEQAEAALEAVRAVAARWADSDVEMLRRAAFVLAQEALDAHTTPKDQT